MAAMLALHQVRFGFPGRPDFLGPISLTVEAGQCWAMVGPNGSGKTTLLRLMAGLCRPSAGVVSLNGRPLSSLPARRRAQQIAYVPQRTPDDLTLPVGAVVLMGRFPYRSFGLFESAEDRRLAEQAMHTTAVEPFAQRLLCTLSGGEAQRVHLAAALAQEPVVLLLDEPTASLDLPHQVAVFGVLREKCAAHGLAAVVVSHDVNLAGRFCTRVVLLSDGRVAAAGSPDDVLVPSVLEPVYGVPLEVLVRPDGRGRPWVVPADGDGERRL
jgi:iron complex transport system ATP-binding protein